MKKRFTFFGWPLVIIPFALIWFGSFLNQIAIAANRGSMPVEASVCVADPALIEDTLHSCMTQASHLKFLCDWIYMGEGIGSIGDMLIEIGTYFQVPCFWIWMSCLGLSAYFKKNFWIE